MTLTALERETLLRVARTAVHEGLEQGRAPVIDPRNYTPALRVPAATYVSLMVDTEVRGCIGTLEARRPLVVDVAAHAFAAAFHDERFPPLSPLEEDFIEVHIAVLSPPEPVTVLNEADLLATLRPGIDGLVISEGTRRATFLPSVWTQVPDPRDFVTCLKQKAGLAARHWSPSLRVARYQVEAFSE